MQKLSFDKRRIKFLLLEGIHANATSALTADGYASVRNLPKSLTGDALKAALKDVHFLGIRSRTELTEEMLAAAPKLTAIGCFCIGTNQVDLAAAAQRGIPVFNAPYSNTRSVAELVLGEAIMLLRGIPGKSALVHRGGWTKSAEGSVEVRGKTLGIVGYGHIGSQVGVLSEFFGMRVVYFDVATKLPLSNNAPCKTLEDLLKVSDFVTLHVPETPQTKG
ncbi:MAG TPA: NAD(P)-dependent oxidoreductase, partial [Lacunisphaera sp.]|nr:NAD(P)-dependent oxidoreductase [Lacunisphaera sp.]